MSAEQSADLARVRRALETYGEDTERRFRDAAKQQLTRGFSEELTAESDGATTQQRKIITGYPLVIPGLWTMDFSTGGIGPLGWLTRAMEFGTLHQDWYTNYQRRARGSNTRSPVFRRTRRQIPTRSQTGWIAYPAGRKLQRRATQMAFHVLVKVAHDAVDGGRNG